MQFGIEGKIVVIIWMWRGLKVTWAQALQDPPAPPTVFVMFPPFFSISFLFLTPASPPSSFALLSFSYCSPLMWEQDEALMESIGSQHLPHLKQTGRSLLLSVPPRASPPSLCAPLYYCYLHQLNLQKALNAPSSALVSHAIQPEFSSESVWCMPIFNKLHSFVMALPRQLI